MASRHEQFVQNQRKRASEIRESALNGTLRSQQNTQSRTSRSDQFRNNQANKVELSDVFTPELGLDFLNKAAQEMQRQTQARSAERAKLPDPLRIGPGFIENSTFAQATQGSPKAIQTFKQATGQTIKPLTEYEQRMEEIQNTVNKNPYLKPIQPLAEWGTGLMSNTDTGNFINRSISTGGGMVIGDRPYYNVTTGNATADKVADIAGTVGGFAGLAFNPAAPGVKGQNLLTGPMAAAEGALATRAGNAAVNAISRQAAKLPGVTPAAADRVTRGIATGAATGAIGNTAYGLNLDQSTGEEMLHNAAMGAAFGAGGEVVARGVGAGWRVLFKKNGIPDSEVSEILSLPVGRKDARINAATSRSVQQAGDEAIANPFTFDLPEGSPQTRRATANAAEGRGEIQQINARLQELESQYGQRVIDEYKYLKQSRDNRGGVSQGQLQRTPEGEVIGRTGRTSQNPLWYQEFYRANGKAPSNKDLYALARERIDNGFRDEAGEVPSWRQESGYDEQVAAYTSALDNLRTGVREVDPALRITDQPLVSERLRDINPQRKGPVRPRVNESSVNTQKNFDPMTDPSVPKYLKNRQARIDAKNAEAAAAKTETVPDVEAPTPLVEPNAAVPAQIEELTPMRQNWFTNLFGNQGVGISMFGSNKRISRNPLTTADQIVGNPLRRDVQGTKAEAQAAARAFHQNMVDARSPLKKLSPKAYDQSIDANRANNIANAIANDKFVNPQGEVIGSSLNDIFSKVARGQTPKFLDYLVLRHAATRMERGERVYAKNLNMTTEKVEKQIRSYDQRFPEFKNIASEWDNFNENMLKTYGVEEGLLSEAAFKALRERNPHYTSMRRQFTTSEKFASPFAMKQTNAFSGQKAPIKEVSPTGSVRNIVDPRRSAIEATGAWVNAAMRNRVMQTLVDAVRKDPELYTGTMEIVQKPAGQRSLKQLLSEGDEVDYVQMLNEDFDKLFNRQRLDEDNVVRAMFKGEPVYLKIKDPEAVKALAGMGAEQSNLVLDVFGKLSDATKYGATGALAPVFSIKGFTMDVTQAMIQSKNPISHLTDLGHAVISSVADTLPKGTPGLEAIRALSQEFRRAGGEYSAALRGEKPLRKGVRALDRDPFLSPKGIVKGAGKVAASPFRALHKVADITENLNRMAAYKGELRRLGGERTPDNIRNAMREAREITTNFSRRGAQSQNLEKLIPYQNAAVQGARKFFSQVKDHPLKTIGMVSVTVLVPKLIEYSKFHDDPDYQIIPARDKYRSLYVGKNDDGTFTKIPLPQEYGAIGGLFVDTLEKVNNDNPRAFKGAADAVVNAYVPPLVSGALQPITQGGGFEQGLSGTLNSTVLAPAVAVMSNRDYAGRPIESKSFEANSPVNRYDERTSSVAIKLGEVLNMSPKKVDYLIRAYGGDPARLLLPLTSQQGSGNVRNTLLKNYILDPQFTNTLSTDFYDGKTKLQQAAADIADGKSQIPTWYSEDLRKMVTSRAKGSISIRLSDLTNQKRALGNDASLTLTERAASQREIQKQINEIYIDINQRMEEAGVPLKR
ncbi:LPD38 domain-containing protein [Paenibacillus sp. NRS-1782]|uniref:LPD38 domain-containing protein n=1 Tax=unclassified Paenibacillus TaxID=185978 RepID=UPI003D29C405